MKNEKKISCENCRKEDCKDCVKEGGKNFCCEHCCKDYTARNHQPKPEPANVCKFC